jgi:hypothetical protein
MGNTQFGDSLAQLSQMTTQVSRYNGGGRDMMLSGVDGDAELLDHHHQRAMGGIGLNMGGDGEGLPDMGDLEQLMLASAGHTLGGSSAYPALNHHTLAEISNTDSMSGGWGGVSDQESLQQMLRMMGARVGHPSLPSGEHQGVMLKNEAAAYQHQTQQHQHRQQHHLQQIELQQAASQMQHRQQLLQQQRQQQQEQEHRQQQQLQQGPDLAAEGGGLHELMGYSKQQQLDYLQQQLPDLPLHEIEELLLSAGLHGHGEAGSKEPGRKTKVRPSKSLNQEDPMRQREQQGEQTNQLQHGQQQYEFEDEEEDQDEQQQPKQQEQQQQPKQKQKQQQQQVKAANVLIQSLYFCDQK